MYGFDHPDHMHGIIILHDLMGKPAAPAAADRPNGTRPSSLSAIIQNFKSISTRKTSRLRRTPGAPLWQRDYYEHIARDHTDLERIQRYIAANPTRWRV
jgi:REP element-mobilizing transposase RayT